ncbi:hypothetical protein [Marinobacterium sediminicola]|uniref:Uncharacterized protein n=1 Tax=Marinobacterium sediminicola TaxID=518898 RepID=A0ABY1S205_9GAMM|nr:hypothetical protein [Marinobacterium sediminicola]ULG68549.1 hypothetical protein LN244_12700 [Marinobacterium sediminicola]SMR76583.1 hypothetical protein SAMN04487964_1123 [Marinobacterium sediminicola]
MEAFSNVPVDPDTRILASHLLDVQGHQALLQLWSWEGLCAMSLIFHEDETASLSDEALRKLAIVSGIPKEGTSFTISRNKQGYAFVNFNFSND